MEWSKAHNAAPLYARLVDVEAKERRIGSFVSSLDTYVLDGNCVLVHVLPTALGF